MAHLPRWRGGRRALLLIVLLPLLYLVGAAIVLERVASGVLRVATYREIFVPDWHPTKPFELGYRGDPREALGLSFETRSLATELGPAPAWFVPGANDARLAAIYVHGIGGAREDGYRHLSLLHAAGLPTLLIGYRNDPDAPPSPSGTYGFGLTEWRDLDVAVRHLAARGHDRLLLVGESMGGAIVGQFLRRSPRADRVVAVALDAPALDFTRVLAHIGDGLGLPLAGVVAPLARELLVWTGPRDLSEAHVIAELAGFPGPLFLAHGTGDPLVPVAISDDLLARRQGLTVHLRTEALHLESWQADAEAYRDAFDAFLAGLSSSD